MSDKTGKIFEGLTLEIFEALSDNEAFTAVTANERLESPDGKIQIDVVLRSKIAGIDLLTIVECKDYPKKNVDRTTVDNLHSVMQDVKAHKAILVARKGFSGGAIKKAKRLGITLCTAHNITNLKDHIPEVPILLSDYRMIDIAIQSKVKSEKKIDNLHMSAFIDDLARCIIVDNFSPDLAPGQKHEVRTIGIKEYQFEAGGETHRVQTDDVRIQFELKEHLYFGYVSDLPNTRALHNISQSETSIFIDKDDFFTLEKGLKPFSHEDWLDAVSCLKFHAISTPDRKGDVRELTELSIDGRPCKTEGYLKYDVDWADSNKRRLVSCSDVT